MNVESGFQIADLRGVVRRRVKVVLASWLVVSLAAYWLAMALPNEYESFATVLVEPQAVDEGLIKAGVATSDLNRRLGLMAAKIMSRHRLSRIIDDLELYEDESNYLERQEIINLMRDQVKVEPVIPEIGVSAEIAACLDEAKRIAAEAEAKRKAEQEAKRLEAAKLPMALNARFRHTKDLPNKAPSGTPYRWRTRGGERWLCLGDAPDSSEQLDLLSAI